jgi:hypothetical protein
LALPGVDFSKAQSLANGATINFYLQEVNLRSQCVVLHLKVERNIDFDICQTYSHFFADKKNSPNNEIFL